MTLAAGAGVAHRTGVAWLLLGEGFSTAQMIGVALVSAGVATVSRR